MAPTSLWTHISEALHALFVLQAPIAALFSQLPTNLKSADLIAAAIALAAKFFAFPSPSAN